jgi:hypothetical protein
MLFTKKLRTRVKSGEVTCSVRIWKAPHVKVGGRYRLDDGHIEVTSIREISWEDLSDSLARDGGFRNLVDMMKTAKHGAGQRVYYVRFRYRDSSRPAMGTKQQQN